MPHATLATPFGDLTLFAEEDALVALEWGRAPDGVETPLLLRALDQLDGYFDGRLQRFDLPLRATGTAFQHRVWARIADIPYGSTQSYGTLAGDLGTSPRALAHACAVNPLPIIVSCHRVVGSHGALGGYSGGEGTETKQALLRLEGAVLPARAATG